MIRQSIAQALRSVSSRALAKNNTLQGTETASGFLSKVLLPSSSTKVQSLLQKPGAAVHETDTVQAAVSKMVREDVGTLAVLSDAGKVVGSFSERNVLNVNGNPKQVKVAEVFDKNAVVSIQPHTTLNHHSISEALETTNGRQLPVACQNSGEFLGLMFVSDVVRAMAGECSFIRVMHDEYTSSIPIHDG